jgi:hypothetical protein
LAVPPGYLASATAFALSAAAPVTIVPVPGRQFCGIRPTDRWFGLDRANGAAFALPDGLLPELASPIAYAPIATTIAAAPAAMNLVILWENMSRLLRRTLHCEVPVDVNSATRR